MIAEGLEESYDAEAFKLVCKTIEAFEKIVEELP